MLTSASHAAVLLSVSASVLLLLTASAHDIAARTVPNWISVALLAFGVLLRVFDHTLLPAMFGGAATFALASFCWRRGWLGGGDVKLLAAAAIAVHPGELTNFFLVTSWTGAALALIYLAARRRLPVSLRARPRGLLARVLRAEKWRLRRGGPLPYACAIAAGALFVLL